MRDSATVLLDFVQEFQGAALGKVHTTLPSLVHVRTPGADEMQPSRA